MNEQHINNEFMRIKDEIKSVMYKFENGYKKRDLNKIEDFMEELFCHDEDTLVFGAAPNEEVIGFMKIKTLVEKDWRYWGDVSLDIEGASIAATQDMACVTVKGEVKMQINEEQLCGRSLNDISEMISNQLSVKEKLLMICDNSSKVLLELERGEKHIWPIRVTAVLMKCNSKWLFKQIHFSHPTISYPGQRIID